MKENYETKQLKVNTPLRGFKAGQVVPVKTQDGIILDPYWRRRLKDATIDKCVELVEKTINKSKKKED